MRTTKYVLSSSTVTPEPLSSLPSACDQVWTNALLPEYTARRGEGMRAAKEPTVRIRPRLREIMPGTTSLVTLRVALLRGGQRAHVRTEERDGHVDFDDVGEVLVGEILEEDGRVVALADVVDCDETGQGSPTPQGLATH